jgi:hypothetical protein
LAWYKKNIEQKYLEKEISALVPRVDPQNTEEFQKGIENALWDCDMSHYKLKEVPPNNELDVRTEIILQYEP